MTQCLCALTASLVTFDTARARELAKIDNLERIAHDLLDKSMQPVEITFSEQISDPTDPVLATASIRSIVAG